jgi:RNA polymerase sigma-54 factor
MNQNPVLEQDSTPGEDLVGDFIAATESASDSQEAEPQDKVSGDEQIAEMIKLADEWHDFLPPAHSRKIYTSEDDEKREHFFASLAEEPSLQEQLMEQLRFVEASPRTLELAELIIGSIDEQGYLRSHLADLAIAGDADMKELDKALKLVQSFDPPGIGARDLKECLILQLKRAGKAKSKEVRLVEQHLDDLARNRLPQIARKMRVSMDYLYDMIAEIRSLNPNPGGSLSKNHPIFVIPEITVEENDGEFHILGNDDNLPRLRISQLYCNLLEDPNTPNETKNYIKMKLTSGKALIKSIEQRQSTIKRIAEIIVDSQYDFLKKGVEHLRPLTMQQVADKLDLHETTISRAIANKYIQTPVGLFEFRYFFSGGYQSADGEEVSSRSVKEKIRDLVNSENKSKPLSDQKIVAMMKEQGFDIARRTVAKYREELGIPASNLRKEF